MESGGTPTAAPLPNGGGAVTEAEMMEQLVVQMMIFGPFMEMLEEDREGEA